jgi:hypothetical protein
LSEFRLNFAKVHEFLANFCRNFGSTLQQDLVGHGIRGGKGDSGGGGMYSGGSRKLSKSFLFGAGL